MTINHHAYYNNTNANANTTTTTTTRTMNKLALAWGPDVYHNLQKEEEAYNNNVVTSNNNDDTSAMSIDGDDFLCPLIPTNDASHIMEIDMLTSISKEQVLSGLIPIKGFY